MKKILLSILLLGSIHLSAQDPINQISFESALMDYNIFKTKSEFVKLEQATHINNLRDLEKIQSLHQEDFKNADQVYNLIEGINKRNLVLKSIDKKYNIPEFEQLNKIKNELANFYYQVGKKYNDSSEKLDAIVSYKALNKAQNLNNSLNLDADINKAIEKAKTKIYLLVNNTKGSKQYIKNFKQIIEKNNDRLIEITDDKAQSDLIVNLSVDQMNHQSFVKKHLQNGAVINDVIHNSYEVEFNNTKGFGQVNTKNFTTAMLDHFDEVLKNKTINYLELNNIINYSAHVKMADKSLQLNNEIVDQYILSSANLKSTVWSNVITTEDRNIQLVTQDIYNSLRNAIYIH
ncbi:hypothetical protein [Faecalibacter sp. LW9]|uniref:hypothetical protein n=1 Tax=Faecalibacter sp. LW9 TaxID=3103144 RepID=UPI002AFDE008|nr:hypothetical protein [Faecalibacter sp. LW9]